MEAIKVLIVKYPDRTNWMMRYTDAVTGKHVARSAKTTSKRDAERAAAKWEAELREGRYQKQQNITWAEFVERLRGRETCQPRRRQRGQRRDRLQPR